MSRVLTLQGRRKLMSADRPPRDPSDLPLDGRRDGEDPTMAGGVARPPPFRLRALASDKERHTKGRRGPLHGIPVILKDNIDTADKLHTTAGSFALLGPAPPQDATVAARLRAAGAVILGKAGLSEWANFRSIHSSSGWSGRGAQVHNPYVLHPNPSGSTPRPRPPPPPNFSPLPLPPPPPPP